MKILHISTSQTGGAALATLRLHKALLDCGVESRVLTLDGDLDNDYIFRYRPYVNFQGNKGLARLIKGFLYHLNIGIGKYWKMHDAARKGHECVYSYPVSPYRVENHSLIRWADVIHLHWCNNFINYPTFFKKVKKPIIWTFHDIAIGYGGFHFKIDHDALLPYYKHIEDIFLLIKRTALCKCNNLTLISLSKEMYTYTKGIDFLKDKNNHIIPNSIDTTLFKSFNRQESRKSLNLPNDKTILLFVSEYVETPSKGFHLLKQTVSMAESEKYLICAVGNYDEKLNDNNTPNTRHVGKITDNDTLSKFYSASDYLVVPSLQESFGQTPLESMACGTPVVVFPTGAMKDYVTPEVGVVCKDCSVEALVQSLGQAIQTHYNKNAIRQYVSECFNPIKIARMHIDVYKSALREQ